MEIGKKSIEASGDSQANQMSLRIVSCKEGTPLEICRRLGGFFASALHIVDIGSDIYMIRYYFYIGEYSYFSAALSVLICSTVIFFYRITDTGQE